MVFDGCAGGSIVVANNVCEPCPLGYYTPGVYDTICLKCPKFRIGLVSSKCRGLDTSEMYIPTSGCFCGGYIIGLSHIAGSSLLIVMMCAYFLLVVYFARTVVNLNLGVSKFSLLHLSFTIMLSALDTATDLLYILVNPFANAIIFGFIIFFYMVNAFPYINYLRGSKPGIIRALITLPTVIASRSSMITILLVVPYAILMIVKSLVLFLAGYLLYTSKLLMLAPIYNNFMFWFTHSNQFQSTDLVSNEHFSESVYYEIFFESVPQIILQVINWLYTTYYGGTIYANNKFLLISVLSSGLTFLFHTQKLIRVKWAGMKIADIKTGFEGISYNEVDDKQRTDIELTELSQNNILHRIS